MEISRERKTPPMRRLANAMVARPRSTRYCDRAMSNQSLASSKGKGTKKIRLPLDHPEIDGLDIRISILVRCGRLTEYECGFLIKKRSELRVVSRRLSRRLLGAPLPSTDCRPLYADEGKLPTSQYFGLSDEIVLAGWVHRLREYIERIEHKYPLPASAGEVGDV